MGYILKQYNHIVGDGSNDEYTDTSISDKPLNYFLNPISFGDDAIKDYSSPDGGFKGSEVTYTSGGAPGFEAGAHYYFHGIIYNGKGNKYNIKLIDNSDSSNIKEQFIKTIRTTVMSNGFTDVEFIFTPVINFSRLIFDLDRDDIRGGTLGPQISLGVLEVSLINNIMGTKLAMTPITSNILPPILKAGIQSRPGTLFCINGEDIRLPHNGIYEVKNGVILVDFFSVVTPKDFINEINVWKGNPINHSFYPLESENPNRRLTSGFTIDYLYYLSTD